MMPLAFKTCWRSNVWMERNLQWKIQLQGALNPAEPRVGVPRKRIWRWMATGLMGFGVVRMKLGVSVSRAAAFFRI